MPQDETTLKCSEINVKEPKTWAWVAAIITSLMLFFTSFSLLNDPACTCDWSFVYALLVGICLLCLCFLCIFRCCACSSAFANKVTPFTQNYWFKAGVYGGYVEAFPDSSRGAEAGCAPGTCCCLGTVPRRIITSFFCFFFLLCACMHCSVGILGLIIYGVEHCCSAGIAAIYVISILAGVLFLVLGFMNRGNKLNNADAPNYSGSVSSSKFGGWTVYCDTLS